MVSPRTPTLLSAFICLLCLTGTTWGDVQGPEIINVTEGSDVTLPCSITGNIESKRFDWKKDGQKEVYLYDAGLDSSKGLSGQSDQFKGRVSHFPGELKNGNASIMIRNTKVADSGNYTCEFQHLLNQKFLMKLLVDAPLKDRREENIAGAAPTPCVRTLKHTNDWVQLQCEVHGDTFKPDVQWQDSDGKTLPAEEPQVSERGGSYDIILNITVTKTDTYRCVATQEEIRHQVHAQIHIYISGPEIIKVTEGSDVTLPCSITEDITKKRFDWKKDGQKEVYVYDSGTSSSQGLTGQYEQFKGRVSHFSGELKNGNASIMIRNVKVADRGNYTCEFQHLLNQKFLMKLLVGAVSKLNFKILGETQDGVQLQCEVHGDTFKPDVQWQDSDGKTLPAEEPQVSERGGSYDIILNITVTKTDTYSCVATQEEIRHQVHTETYVPVHGPEIINVTEGSDVTLPCSITGNIESKRFDWKKDGQKEVYLYDAGLDSSKGLSGQSDQFKGRVSHFPGELKNGNASIMIRNTKVADSGNYTCEFQHLLNQKFLMKLLVDAPLKDRREENIPGAAPTPCVRTLKHTNDGVQLQCEVHGDTFKPDVQWQDSDGKTLPAEEPQVSERGGSYDIILQTTVTKTDTYRCVATQEEIRHQVHAQIYVRINVPESHTGWIVAGVLGVILFGAVLLAVLRAKGFIKCSKGQSKTSVPDEDPHLYL